MSSKRLNIPSGNISSRAAANNADASGISKPAVQPLQKAAKDKHTNDKDPASPELAKHLLSEARPMAQLKQYTPVPGGRNAVVQRITGFEMETFIPLYRPVEGANEYVAMEKGWSPDIGNFLFGGVLYGHTYAADPEGHFTVSADHNGKMTTPHRKLLHLLMLAGLIRMNSPFRGMAIAEYITAPVDETAPGARERLIEQITYTNAHIKKAIALQANPGSEPMPDGNGVYTGIPVGSIEKWVSQNVTVAGPILAVLEELKTVAQQTTLNMQKTTGVLPEDIPLLYESATAKLQKSASRPEQVMSKVMQLSVQMATEALAAIATEPKPPGQHAAILGFLTYLATHIVVDNLSATNYISATSTKKNLFPYFPKVPLSTAFQAMPEETLKPDYIPYWEALIDALIDNVYGYDLSFWEENFKLSKGADLKSAVFMDQSNLKVYKTNARALLKKMVAAERPEVHVNIEKNLPGLDTPHPAIVAATGQKAIPVEDRYLNQKYGMGITTGNMEELTIAEFDEAGYRMGKHLPSTVEGHAEPNDPYTKGRYRDLQQQASVLKTRYEESEAMAKTIEEQTAYLKSELEKVKTRDEEEALQQIKQLTEEKKALETELEGLDVVLDEKKAPLEERMAELEETQEEVKSKIWELRFPDEEPEDKQAAGRELAKLVVDERRLDEQINDLQNAIYKMEDDLREELEAKISDKEHTLSTYAPEYEEKLKYGLVQSEESLVKEGSNVMFYKDLLSKANIALLPMTEAERSGNVEAGIWKEYQAIAAQTFLEIKNALWVKAHEDNPHAGILSKELLTTEYKDSFGIEKNRKAAAKYARSLEKLNLPEKQEEISGLAGSLGKGMEQLNEMTGLLDSKIGTAPPDEILLLMNEIMILNQEITEKVARARSLVAEPESYFE